MFENFITKKVRIKTLQIVRWDDKTLPNKEVVAGMWKLIDNHICEIKEVKHRKHYPDGSYVIDLYVQMPYEREDQVVKITSDGCSHVKIPIRELV